MKNWMRRWWSWSTHGGTGRKVIGFGLPAVLIAILLLVAQGDEEPAGGDEEVGRDRPPTAAAAQVHPSPTPEPSPMPEQATSPRPDSRCEAVSQAMLDLIDDQLTVDGGSLRNGFAVKSEDYENVYMIAADIQGPGMDDDGQVGVWAANGLEPEGSLIILAVDGLAKEFSDWFDGDQTDAQLSLADDGVDEARECVGDPIGD